MDPLKDQAFKFKTMNEWITFSNGLFRFPVKSQNLLEINLMHFWGCSYGHEFLILELQLIWCHKRIKHTSKSQKYWKQWGVCIKIV